jgi:hypothetical protein
LLDIWIFDRVAEPHFEARLRLREKILMGLRLLPYYSIYQYCGAASFLCGYGSGYNFEGAPAARLLPYCIARQYF